MIKGAFDEIWAYLKLAPLPVVLAIVLILAGAGAARVEQVKSSSEEVNKLQSERITINKEIAVTAQERAARAEDNLKEINQKLAKLMEAVAEMKGEIREHTRVSHRP